MSKTLVLLLLLSAVVVCDAQTGIYARLERYLDDQCTQKVLYDHLFYHGECWNDNRGSILWTDSNDVGINQCTWALSPGGRACRGTPTLCQRIPWGDCVPNFQNAERALPPHEPFRAPVTHVRWVRFDPSQASYYTMLGPYQDEPDCNVQRQLVNGKLPDTFQHVALEDRSPRRLLFSVTDNRTASVPLESTCHDFICHTAQGNSPCAAAATVLSSPTELNVCWKPSIWNSCPPTSTCTPTTPVAPIRLDQSDVCTQMGRHPGGCSGCGAVAHFDLLRDNPNVGGGSGGASSGAPKAATPVQMAIMAVAVLWVVFTR